MYVLQLNLYNGKLHSGQACDTNVYQRTVKSVYKTNHFAKYTWIHKHQTQIFEVSPFNTTLVKRAHKARTCWYRWPFHLIYWYQVKEKYKKGLDRHNIFLFLFLYKCIMANTSAILQQTAHATYQLLSAQQEPCKKSLTLNKQIFEFSGISQENGPLVETRKRKMQSVLFKANTGMEFCLNKHRVEVVTWWTRVLARNRVGVRNEHWHWQPTSFSFLFWWSIWPV